MSGIDSLSMASFSPMDYAYFAQAMQTPTPANYMGMAQAMQNQYNIPFQGTSSSAQTNTSGTTTTTAPQAEEKKNSKAKWILGGIAVIGATALCIAAHKKGPANEKGVKRIIEGAKTIFGKGGKQEQATLRMINGKKVATIPGKVNVMRTAEEVEKIGLKAADAESIIKGGVETPGLLNEGNELRSFVYDIKNESEKITNKVVWNNKNGYTVLDAKGKKVEDISALKDSIENYIKCVKEGKVELNHLDRVCIRNTNKETGLVSNFIMDNGNLKLKDCMSKYLPLDHMFVQTEMKGNGAFKNAVEIFEKGKAKDLIKLTLADGATVNLAGKGINAYGYTIDRCEVDANGNVLKLFTNKGAYNNTSEMYKHLMAAQEENIAKIINEKNRKNWENIIYNAVA